MLSIYPAGGMLVLAASGEWRSLGFVDAEVEAAMCRILQRAPSWSESATGSRERLTFPGTLLGHENQRLHQLANLEVGCAPYSEIKGLRGM